MVGGVNRRNVDKVIEFAKGGFGCVEIFWERSTPTYEPNPQLFPDGLAGMKRVADKVHAAGLQLGLHVMQGMVGWGSKDDPYLTPKADPRLLQDRYVTLAGPLETKATEIRAQNPRPNGSPTVISCSKARLSVMASGCPADLPSASAGCTEPRWRRMRPATAWATW